MVVGMHGQTYAIAAAQIIIKISKRTDSLIINRTDIRLRWRDRYPSHSTTSTRSNTYFFKRGLRYLEEMGAILRTPQTVHIKNLDLLVEISNSKSFSPEQGT